MYLVLPDASKAILSGNSERCSMSLGYKHYSPHDHRTFGSVQTTVLWTVLTTFGTENGTVDRADSIQDRQRYCEQG